MMYDIKLAAGLILALMVPTAPLAMAEEDQGDSMEPKYQVSLYGRLWPRLTLADSVDTSLDVTDALSRVGILAKSEFGNGMTAILKGEWDVDVEANGDLGDAREAYVALQGDSFGFIGIGKQQDPYYNIIAAGADIFYHRSSPFGYDNESPFRSNNLVRYAYTADNGVHFDLGLQVNGDGEFNNATQGYYRTNGTFSQDPGFLDSIGGGISYSANNGYIGIGYRQEEARGQPDADGFVAKTERRLIAAAANVTTGKLYLTGAVQFIKFESEVLNSPNPNKVDQDRLTGDLSLSYDLNNDWTIIGGGFYYDDDKTSSSNKHFGTNLTLVKRLNKQAQIFGEWVSKYFSAKDKPTLHTVSFGLRFDFSVPLL